MATLVHSACLTRMCNVELAGAKIEPNNQIQYDGRVVPVLFSNAV